jgi:PHD/YefM family antitoxin component YafN of YafNO toxin-antitoxin module
MTLEQLINQKVQQLPSNLQMEVLDFVEFLETKQVVNPQENITSSDEDKAQERRFDALLETLEILQDPELSEILTEAIQQDQSGQRISWEDAQKQLGW